MLNASLMHVMFAKTYLTPNSVPNTSVPHNIRCWNAIEMAEATLKRTVLLLISVVSPNKKFYFASEIFKKFNI